MPGEADWFVETWLLSCFFFGSHSLSLPYSGARSNGRLMAGSHSFPFSCRNAMARFNPRSWPIFFGLSGPLGENLLGQGSSWGGQNHLKPRDFPIKFPLNQPIEYVCMLIALSKLRSNRLKSSLQIGKRPSG